MLPYSASFARSRSRATLVFALVGFVTLPLVPAPPAPSRRAVPPPPLRSTVFPADAGQVRNTTFGVSRALVDTVTANLRRLEIHVTTLAPGKTVHPPHRHPHEELMIIRSGTLEVCQNGATRRAGPGAVIFEASNELHGVRNPGPDSATYVVIRIDPHDLANGAAVEGGAPC